MSDTTISAHDPFERKRVAVLDTDMAYVDVGSGDPIVFLHGNPTSSYLWRNVIPHLSQKGRCLAPDLVGMGDSGKSPQHAYRYVDQSRYLDAWFDALSLHANVTLVLHDWGSGLGFYWAHRHSEQVKAIVYMEALVHPVSWSGFPENARGLFQAIRSPQGEKLILEQNTFVENILPASVIRHLSEEEMDTYRHPYLQPGESRLPTLIWPREIPIDGEPADTYQIMDSYARWLASSTNLPKLFINADPGSLLTGALRDFCRTWPNQQEVTVKGIHFIQEDSPVEIGEAIAAFLTQFPEKV
jgi:haloalkane dehalogenase